MSESGSVDYDVAISFLSTDIGLAKQLHDGLASQLKVFTFMERQKEIAGTDGLESFRKIYRTNSRLVVVLFRSGWGETNWTRVEQLAITDRFLSEGPNCLFFLMLDKLSAPPPWLPEQRVRFILEDFGVEQAIGAIKLRVQELGGTIRTESITEIASRSEVVSAYNRDTKNLLKSEEGVRQFNVEVSALFNEINRLANEAREAAPGLKIEIGGNAECVVVRCPRGSIKVLWVGRYTNTLAESFLSVQLFRSELIIPGENKFYVFKPPDIYYETRFVPARIYDLGWCWVRDERVYSSMEVAVYTVKLFLDDLMRSE